MRYADDFIITGISKEVLEDEVKPLVVEFLSRRGLRLSAEKTRVTHINRGFDFLGWNVRKYSSKLLIKPSKENTKAFLDKCRKVIKANGSAKQKHLIWQLNPIIRGWANYHKHQVASDAFARADAMLWKALWRWARRRHCKKGRQWVAKRYWHHIDNRQWTFAETVARESGGGGAKLVYASDTKIKRHTKVKADANLFDPAWELYFEELKRKRMLDSIQYRKRISKLHARQKGVCTLCRQPINHETGWHVHHVVRRVDGGSDNLDNLMLLHPNCHMQIHSLHTSVSKPVPSGA